MTSEQRSWFVRRMVIAGALLLALTLTVSAQQQAAPRSDYQPGFLSAVSRWFNQAIANPSTATRDARGPLGEVGAAANDVAKGAAGLAKDTANTVARLPATRVVGGRERCVRAANGAPDCQAAANAVCRSNGHTAGRSLDTQSAEDCPARLWLSGRPPAPGECKVETYVTRAICQ